MPRAHTRPAAPTAGHSPPTSPNWAQWAWKVQAFPLQMADDLLGVFNRYLGALSAARDAQGIGQIQQTAVGDWMACLEGIQGRWAELARQAPSEAWTAWGWPPRHPGLAAAVTDHGEDARDPIEQSKLAAEMLLRPWVQPPDLDHTDEFVA